MIIELKSESSLISRDISKLRDKYTSASEFGSALHRLSLALAFYSGKLLPLNEYKLETPLEETTGYNLVDPPILSPVLRAGLGMLSGFREVYPESSVAMIGTRRNEETLEPENYYVNIPAYDLKRPVFILDPMLATGGTVAHAINSLKKIGYSKFFFFSVISAPEGIKKLEDDHPDVNLFTCVIDRELNSRGYILPGLGDAGDRFFGT